MAQAHLLHARHMCVAQQHPQMGPTVTALLMAKVKMHYEEIFTNLEAVEGPKFVLTCLAV